MQGLLKLVEQLKKQTRPVTNHLLVNTVKEYLQVIILKAIYKSKYSSALSFMGGTALRICYNLKRFSEDLDFALDRPKYDYLFKNLLDVVYKELLLQGYTVEINSNIQKTVQKAFIKFSKILYPLGLAHMEEQKIHIKLEVDTNPIKVSDKQLESFFVTKFDEIFPILKHKLETSFAGKISAVIGRKYTKGRDYYDLIWYLARQTDIDIKYLNTNMRLLKKPIFKNRKEVLNYIEKIVNKMPPEEIFEDISRFLEDPHEEEWLKNYQVVFKKLLKDYSS